MYHIFCIITLIFEKSKKKKKKKKKLRAAALFSPPRPDGACAEQWRNNGVFSRRPVKEACFFHEAAIFPRYLRCTNGSIMQQRGTYIIHVAS